MQKMRSRFLGPRGAKLNLPPRWRRAILIQSRILLHSHRDLAFAIIPTLGATPARACGLDTGYVAGQAAVLQGSQHNAPLSRTTQRQHDVTMNFLEAFLVTKAGGDRGDADQYLRLKGQPIDQDS